MSENDGDSDQRSKQRRVKVVSDRLKGASQPRGKQVGTSRTKALSWRGVTIAGALAVVVATLFVSMLMGPSSSKSTPITGEPTLVSPAIGQGLPTR
jgi:hypothetical protein